MVSNPPDRPLGEAYTYIPFTVLGDFRFDQEPDWLSLQQRSAEEFWVGLNQRNWTCSRFE